MAGPVVIIGGGIVGLATAWHLSMDPAVGEISVLEKEDGIALHQTGRNSGVIHSGIYYRPGSLKAVTCRSGRARLLSFCDAESIPYDICGKVIVATTRKEEEGLDRLLEQGQLNGVTCRRIDRAALGAREPHVTGLSAIEVDDAGIVDYGHVCRALADGIVARGHRIVTGTAVTGLRRSGLERVIETPGGTIRAGFLVNCGGLFADRIARWDGIDPGVQIVPFRGEYYELTPEARSLCRHLVYPVPDPAYPFLGVHFTRMIDGTVECGPNALLALGREAYTMRETNPADILEMLRFKGFRRLAMRHWSRGAVELSRSMFRSRYLAALRRLIPEIEAEHLLPAQPGIRAQAVLPDGSMADDFIVRESAGAIHVCNAPSPAATAGLEIGYSIAEKIRSRYERA